MMELYLSSLPTVIPSRVWACNLDRLSLLSVSWLKYPIENNSNHILESGLALWKSSNSVLSFRPKRPGTWLSIITARRTAKYQNYLPTCFYVMYALAICIRVLHVCSSNPFEYLRPEGSAMMLEPFKRIQRRALPPINFLSKSDCNRWVKHPASYLNCYSVEEIDFDDRDDILYSQQ